MKYVEVEDFDSALAVFRRMGFCTPHAVSYACQITCEAIGEQFVTPNSRCVNVSDCVDCPNNLEG